MTAVNSSRLLAKGYVASYGTVFAAQLAVDHLVECGMPANTLRIVPADPHPAAGWRERTHRRPRDVRLASTGAIATAATAVAVVAITSSLTLMHVLTAAVLAAVFAVAAASVERSQAARVRRRAQTTRLVEADRFDVVCTGPTEQAKHLLGRWWNPQAQPLTPGAEQGHEAGKAAERRIASAA
jgi:hypothetical protein